MNFIKSANRYLSLGLSVIPVDGNKRSTIAWKQYTITPPTESEINELFSGDRIRGIAIICGVVSGSLEVIDLDSKYDTSGTLYENFCSDVISVSQELFDKLLIIETKSGGKHFYYRCEVIEGNQKLAQRPATDEEIKENPNDKVKVLLETRGNSGYVVAPPTDGYKLISGTQINDITANEREALLEICRSFNQYIIEQPKPHSARNEGFALTPWEDYNSRGVDDMIKALEKHGWTIVKHTNNKVIFKRPAIQIVKPRVIIPMNITCLPSLLHHQYLNR
jgi:hypothetical protein